MGDFPSSPQALPLSIHTFSRYCLGFTSLRATGSNNPASATWGTANSARYVPVQIPFPYPVVEVFWGNGSTTTGNGDFGIYTAGGRRIYSTGSIARSGASALQFVSVGTPFILSPGLYYFALAMNATTNGQWANTSVTAVLGRLVGMQQEASALPLPATMTPVTHTLIGLPLMGIARV